MEPHQLRRGWFLAGAIAMLPAAADAQVRLQERATVARALVDVRVPDGRGQPITDLSTADFSVELDGRKARVEWSQWIGADPGPAVPDASAATAFGAPVPPAGRRIVFLFQKDLRPSRV